VKSRQESYANKRHRPVQFEVGDHIHFCQWWAWRDLEWKGSYRLVTLDHSPFLRSVEPWHTSWSYHRHRQGSMTSSTYRNWRSAWMHPWMWFYHKCARVRFDISRAPDQDLGSKESCHEAEDDQVLQVLMEQPYGRRSNMGEWRFSPFSPSGVWPSVVRERAIVRCPFRNFSPFKSQDEILF
jgi:hypothetical protein